MSRNNTAQFRETAKRRKALEEQYRRERVNRAWEIARQAAVLLRHQFGCKQVAVFGSLLQPELFHMYSDVDIAVWGIHPQSYLRAVAQVTSLDSDISVDLIAVEEASESLRKHIEEEAQTI